MTNSRLPQSIKKVITVEAPQERAFRVFTEHSETWWPPDHRMGKAPFKAIALEGRVEGRWYEVGEDGKECDWGRVLVWEPPRRLVLGWQLNDSFEYDPSFLTEVEVVFTPEGPRRTRVELEHRNLERFASVDRTRESLEGGWGGILALYERRVAAGAEVRAQP